MRGQSGTVEEKIAAIAGRAHGVVTRAELLAAGLSSNGIDREIRKGLLIRQYPGVYRVGHAAPSIDASFIAAVKACGEGAFLRGRAGGYLLGLLRRPPPPARGLDADGAARRGDRHTPLPADSEGDRGQRHPSDVSARD